MISFIHTHLDTNNMYILGCWSLDVWDTINSLTTVSAPWKGTLPTPHQWLRIVFCPFAFNPHGRPFLGIPHIQFKLDNLTVVSTSKWGFLGTILDIFGFPLHNFPVTVR